MTEILCNWLNNELKLSRKIDKSSIARDFSTGFLFGEIFNRFQLQDDFGSFSAGQSSNAKLYNFMQLEPTFNLLEIPFDANIAYDVMTQKYGVATRLLYQMFISLQRKVKNNLTGAAMQTMRASAPVKLEMIESGLYKERLKTLIPRESDLTLHQVSTKFEKKRDENEKKARAQKYKQHMEYEAIKQEQRTMELEKSRLSRLKQTELLAKIQAATVHIPKPPPSKTLQAIKHRRDMRNKREAESTHLAIRSFEENLKKLVAPAAAEARQVEEDVVAAPSGFEYLDRIKTRLSEERSAREERAKRRRKVLVDQMKAHHAQEEAHRQEQIVQRLMRQSQMERRVAVQLMQVRSEKDNIRKNRIFREKQYEERRLKDFQDALDLEAKLAMLAKEEYEENAAQEKELHNRNMARKRQERYKKHYQACSDILSGIIDFSCKIIEYRDLTERKVPEKLVREWKKLFLEGEPLYENQESSRDAELQARREEVLNSQDFAEYKNMVGEWKPHEEAEFKKPPETSILGHILHRMFNMVHPPEVPPPPPKFPDFPIQAAVVGKMFAGKSTILEQLANSHNISHLSIDKLLASAIEAFKSNEMEPMEIEVETTVTTVNVEPPTPHTGESRRIGDDFDSDENEKDTADEKVVIERQMSERAKLGGEALKYLETGEAVPDDILVQVLAAEIHNIPEGRGWLLDGFPTNVQQAVLLEKAITGNDVSAVANPVKKRLSKSSSLVSDPKPAPQPVVGTTALDVVLVLDVSDELVLKRAMGRTHERKDDKVFHEEFSPAPLGSRTGIGETEKIVPMEDEAFDKDQVQHRISTFHDSWKKLEVFYSKLSTIQHVDADQNRENAYEDAEKALFQTLERVKNKGKDEESVKEEPEEEQKEELAPPKPEPSEASRSSSPTSKTSKAPSPSGSKKSKSPKERKKSAEKGGKSRSRSGSRKGSGKSKKSRSPTPTPAPPQEEIQGPPPPKPGNPDWVYVDELLSIECARIAVPMWDNTELVFKNSCMHIFHQIRMEREGIIRYIYQSRNNFRAHLRRPDPKQTFVDAWQKDFNEIAYDIRDDEETKAEMHQRLYDLRERLWDICDTKKEDAESERTELMSDGWLEDHLGLLLNQYLSLMQTEIDRFKSTTKIVKDYYSGMQNKIPVEDSTSITRLPLVELDVDEPVNAAFSSETVGSDGQNLQESTSEIKKTKKGKDEEGEATGDGDGYMKIPLIQRGATFSLATEEGGKGKKGKGADPGTDAQLGEGELEEKTIVDAYNTAVSFVANLVQSDIAAKEAEVEEERRLKEEEDKAKMAAAAPADKKGGGKKKSAKGKKGTKSKSPTPTPPTPVDEISEDDKRKIEIENNMREEYFAALKEEEERIKCNLMLIRYRAVLTLSELKEAMSTSYAEMLEWLGERYLSEMKSIEQLTETSQHAIESGTKLKHQVRLDQDKFVVNLELKVARTPSPPPIPPPVEVTMPENFTVVQLTHLLHQFRKVSPSGTIANKSFTELLTDSALLTFGLDSLPESWLTVTYSQLVELCNTISPKCEYVDWRKFLLTIAKPWPMPSVGDLIQARKLFQDADVAENGWITKDQYLEVKTWLCDVIPQEETSEMSYPRMNNLHQFFFEMFADWEQTPPRLDYVNMLMYFAMDEEALQGYMRALSVAVGQPFPKVYKVINAASSSSKVLDTDDGFSDSMSVSNVCVKADSQPKPLVSVQAWWLVMHHGFSRLADSHRFSVSDDPDDKYSLERIQSIYENLEAENFAPQTLQLLLQHPLIQDAILSTKRYQLPDIRSIFDRPAVNVIDGDDSQSIQASIG